MEGYYFIVEDKKANPIKYFTFPNNYCVLSVNQNAEVQLRDGKYIISSTDNNNITADLFSRYTEPLEVLYENVVDEITIYFKPLGINYFMDDTIIFKQPTINHFIPFADYVETMKNIFTETDRQKQIESLENY